MYETKLISTFDGVPFMEYIVETLTLMGMDFMQEGRVITICTKNLPAVGMGQITLGNQEIGEYHILSLADFSGISIRSVSVEEMN